MFCVNAGGTLAPAYAVPDSLRSAAYHAAGGGKVGSWNPENIAEFRPQRWLRRDAGTGEEVFDAAAGPQMQFGAGPRGCFGRKLAYLELRVAVVLVVWSFELGGVPERYSGWEGVEQLVNAPVQAFLRLREV